jgi:hypothetical protein
MVVALSPRGERYLLAAPRMLPLPGGTLSGMAERARGLRLRHVRRTGHGGTERPDRIYQRRINGQIAKPVPCPAMLGVFAAAWLF